MDTQDDLIARAEYIVSLHNQCRCKWSQTMGDLIAALKATREELDEARYGVARKREYDR